MPRLRRELSRRPEEAARFLLGRVLVRRFEDGRAIGVRIVETEAYLGVDDPAAHAYGGRQTARTAPLWGPPGTVYVYFIYGVHHCLNLAVEPAGVPGCVLIRAAEPLPGSGLDPLSCRGPGRLCRSLGLQTGDSGTSVFDPKSRLQLRDGDPPSVIGVSPRIGITKAVDRPLRFFDPASPAVSARYPSRRRA